MNDKNKNAEIWYLYHSGFAVKTSRHFLVFDYYLDKPEGKHPGLETGVIYPEEVKDLDMVVFSSHSHSDHFNPVILTWNEHIKKIRYVLSSDIKAGKPLDNVMYVSPGHQYESEGVKVKVLESTDIGSAFLVDCDGLTMFHAGDLNWWHWEGEPDDENAMMGKNYREQIDILKGTHIDFSFIPLDPRLEKHYLLGLDYFMKTAGSDMVFPMHFGKDYSVFEWIKTDPKASGYLDKTVEISRRGQKFIFNR